MARDVSERRRRTRHLRLENAEGRRMMLYRAAAVATPALARRVIFVTADVAAIEAERFRDESGRWLARPLRLADLPRVVRETLA
jgi:hypothetical protein